MIVLVKFRVLSGVIMSDRPFRFGIMVGHAPDVATFTTWARRAEEHGFDTLITPDPVTGNDPLTALTAVAAATTKLHFGTFVLAAPFRDPKQLAWQARTLNDLSGGRLELGIGAGRPGADEQAATLGREFGTPKQRFEQLAEAVAEIKALSNPPRLLMSGAGPKVLALAGREADTVTFTWRPGSLPEEVDAVVERFKQAAGARFDDIELNINVMAVGKDLPAQVQKFIGKSAAELAESGAVSVLAGSPEENIERLLEWRSRWGISYVTVAANYLDQFAPVVAKLSGS
jgi:probable F420-dependent oxidoreductase